MSSLQWLLLLATASYFVLFNVNSVDVNAQLLAPKKTIRLAPKEPSPVRDEDDTSWFNDFFGDLIAVRDECEGRKCSSTPNSVVLQETVTPLILTPEEPSRDLCQTLADQLYLQVFEYARPVEEPEMLATLQLCIDYIDDLLQDSPDDVELVQLHSVLVSYQNIATGNLDHEERPHLPEAAAQEEVAPTNNGQWQPPSVRLLNWLRHPSATKTLPQAELQTYCPELMTFLEANFPLNSKGPKVDQLWQIPLESFRKRLGYCSKYYKKEGNLDRVRVIKIIRERTRRRIKKEKARTGDPQQRPEPSENLLNWLRAPSTTNQIIDVQTELETYCPELVTILEAHFVEYHKAPKVEEKWNIPLEDFKDRLDQCSGYFKRLNDSARMATIDSANHRTRQRLLRILEGRRQAGNDHTAPPPSAALLAWLRVPVEQMVEVDAEQTVHCPELIPFSEANFPAKQIGTSTTNVEQVWNIPLQCFRKRLAQCSSYFASRGNAASRERLNVIKERVRHRILYETKKRRQQGDPAESNIHEASPKRPKH